MTCGVRVLRYVMKCDIKVHKCIMISNSMHYELYSHGHVMFYLKLKFYLLIMYLLCYEASIMKSFIYLYIRCTVWECMNILCYVMLEFMYDFLLHTLNKSFIALCIHQVTGWYIVKMTIRRYRRWLISILYIYKF